MKSNPEGWDLDEESNSEGWGQPVESNPGGRGHAVESRGGHAEESKPVSSNPGKEVIVNMVECLPWRGRFS